MPRCDLLVWILVVKLAPSYYRKLNRLLTDTGRYRELPSWRKEFKRTWRKLERTPITLPQNDAYKPNVIKWVCTCPSFAISRFLVCKHLVQGVHHVPPVFFLEVKRRRTTPFWQHPTLKPLDDSETVPSVAEDDSAPPDADSDEESDDGLVDTGRGDNAGKTFEEAMNAKIETIMAFAEGLKYQIQFRDERMLQALEREGASFWRLAGACLTKEKAMRSTRGAAPTTWDKSTSSAMFYRARPSRSDRNT